MIRRQVVAVAVALLVVGAAGSPRAQAGCTAEQGQAYIEQGSYKQAVKEFTCVIESHPTEADGYRGRAEARLLLGLYSDAYRDYGQLTARVLPVHPDAVLAIYASYDARLAADPQSIPALTGASFARWWDFQYAQATHLLNQLLTVSPDDVYGTLFRGSSRLLRGATNAGIKDIDRAIALAPGSGDVHFIAADAYTYGQPDPQRAFIEASLALKLGLDTPRVNAILGSAYLAFGNMPAAAAHIKRHIDQVTSELVQASPLLSGGAVAVPLVPGRTFDIPIPAVAGETIAIATTSKDYWDSIAVLLAPDGTPVVGSDDANKYMAAFEWPAAETGTYHLRVAFFEALNTGVLTVTRK